MNKTEILFGTSSKHKLREAKLIFENTQFEINHHPVDLIELQETIVEKIAIYSLEQLPINEQLIFVEDTGLYIDELNGFPGPYASHAFKTLGNSGILKLLTGNTNRKAYFESCVAFKDEKSKISSFIARCEGNIAETIRGELWGFDPIFIPLSPELNPQQQTFSELGDNIKKYLSHRAKALEKLKDFMISNQKLKKS